jgi:hypothetical protein
MLFKAALLHCTLGLGLGVGLLSFGDVGMLFIVAVLGFGDVGMFILAALGFGDTHPLKKKAQWLPPFCWWCSPRS